MKSNNRREFLLEALKLAGQVTLANAAIYSISLATGDIAAGAKTWVFKYGSGNTIPCTGNHPCPTSFGPCPTLGANMTRFNAGCDTFEKLNCAYRCE